MPKDKDLKRRIRARMEKTGESYTAARSHILRSPPLDLPDDYATLAGQTDETLRAKTGRAWPEWIRALDAIGAAEMPHREIAAWVNEQTGLGWWSQTVTVGYERIRGLRDVGQRRDGGYEANKSRTMAAPAAAAFDAFTNEERRRRWLDADLTIRRATHPKSIRITWPDGTDVIVGIDDKGPAKCTVALTHGKLASRKAVDEAKAFWGERLEALKEVVEGEG